MPNIAGCDVYRSQVTMWLIAPCDVYRLQPAMCTDCDLQCAALHGAMCTDCTPSPQRPLQHPSRDALEEVAKALTGYIQLVFLLYFCIPFKYNRYKMHHIAVFASGEGTNAENIIRYFKHNDTAQVSVVIYNRKEAGVKAKAESLGIPAEYVPKDMLSDESRLLPLLDNYGVDFIVLAGFLLLIPHYLVHRYHQRIINIHPSLLPKHCGKGMYGMKVHEEVVRQGDTETGITIHLIDEDYDRGKIILQAVCPVLKDDTAEQVAQKVHALEYTHYPKAIEDLLRKTSQCQ